VDDNVWARVRQHTLDVLQLHKIVFFNSGDENFRGSKTAKFFCHERTQEARSAGNAYPAVFPKS
jgi:hypothetical protein